MMCCCWKPEPEGAICWNQELIFFLFLLLIATWRTFRFICITAHAVFIKSCASLKHPWPSSTDSTQMHTRSHASSTSHATSQPPPKRIGNRRLTRQNEHGICFCIALLLHPGVGRAGELVRPVGRPPRGGVEVHIVGVGFESERLAGVAVRRVRSQVDRLVLIVLVSIALWGRQVHSVAVVVLPVGFVVKWLCVLGAKRAGVKLAQNQSQQKVLVRKILQKSRRSQFR